MSGHRRFLRLHCLAPAAIPTSRTIERDDDVSFTSIDYDPAFTIEPDNVIRAMFFGLGADGTIGRAA